MKNSAKIFNRFSLFTLSAGFIAIGLGCAPSDPYMSGPEKPLATVHDFGMINKAHSQPQVDVLFVVDDSDSMENHIRNVQDNMDKFSAAFTASANVDFHIGVVKIFDSITYGPIVKNYTPNGQLTGNFVQRDATTLPDLQKILDFHVHDLADGGPQYEELFSPIKAALTNPMLTAPSNLGFYRRNANLAIILVTDADDSSPSLSPDELEQFLHGLKGFDSPQKVAVYGVLALPGSDCKMDPIGPPIKILQFLNKVNGPMASAREFPICDPNYGSRLAAVGQEIVASAISESFSVELQATPVAGSIVVTAGSTIVPATSWHYESGPNAVVLDPAYVSTLSDESQIQVTYKKVPDSDLGK